MTTAQSEFSPLVRDTSGLSPLSLLCWSCGIPISEISWLPPRGLGKRSCDNCGAYTSYNDGIWIALAPQRAKHFSRFVVDYEFIRLAEGRGSANANYYLALPYEDLSGNNSAQWTIRAKTFRELQKAVVSPLASACGRPLRVLDLGAGTGWMSYRLAQMGHLPVAVDLVINDQDGLGAARHYEGHVEPLFPRVQAELDRLPLPSSAFDLAIFNASFHYSEAYPVTFAEAFRCVRPGGVVVIADTPWYESEESGQRMVKEKHTLFAARHGIRADSLSSMEYLTPERLRQLRERFDAEWTVVKPYYGMQWTLRPLRAKLSGRRPPSRFRIYVAKVKP